MQQPGAGGVSSVAASLISPVSNQSVSKQAVTLSCYCTGEAREQSCVELGQLTTHRAVVQFILCQF